MTKSTITDERITSVIDRLEHFASNLKWTDVRGAQDLLTAADGLRELQERRKADSEPVGYFGRFDPDDEDLIDQCSKNVKGAFPLYRHAQPAPVVPEEMPCGGAADDYHDGYQDGWNACRAAMLQAEPVTTANKLGNSPAIPDTWIPVSERLPEEGGRYWCYVEEQNSLGKSHYQWNCSWNGEIWGGAMMYGRVTHWMPLPAAPQEVKNV